jgi:hypothetical protein
VALLLKQEGCPTGLSGRSPVLMMKTTDMRNCHNLSLFWRFN